MLHREPSCWTVLDIYWITLSQKVHFSADVNTNSANIGYRSFFFFFQILVRQLLLHWPTSQNDTICVASILPSEHCHIPLTEGTMGDRASF